MLKHSISTISRALTVAHLSIRPPTGGSTDLTQKRVQVLRGRRPCGRGSHRCQSECGPNTSLSNGEIDANLFQNITFLANCNGATGSVLVSIGEIYLPVAVFYSNTLTSLDQLADGAKIAIPDDPTNEGRALEMLAAKGLIETSENPSVLADITGNPRRFDFTEIENASLPGVLPDVDTAFVTISFALPAGLKLSDAILVEGQSSKYFNVLATTPELAKDPRMQRLYEILISDETQAHMKETFGDQMVPDEK